MDSVDESIMIREFFLKGILAIAFVKQKVLHTLVDGA